MSKAREFWMYQNEEDGAVYVCDYMQRGFSPDKTFNPTRLIEHSAYLKAIEALKDFANAKSVNCSECDGGEWFIDSAKEALKELGEL